LWWPDFAGEVAAAVLPGLCSWAAVLGRGGLRGEVTTAGEGAAAGERRGYKGRAWPRCAGAMGKGATALMVVVHGLRRPRRAGGQGEGCDADCSSRGARAQALGLASRRAARCRERP
jgi:hypothetical protein